jgi:hypothetical protein
MVLLDAGNWPERSRAHKGATKERYLCGRPMSQKEAEETIYKYRLTFYRYNSWAGLIEDEIEILGEGHPFIERLREESKKTINIPTQKIGTQSELFEGN